MNDHRRLQDSAFPHRARCLPFELEADGGLRYANLPQRQALSNTPHQNLVVRLGDAEGDD